MDNPLSALRHRLQATGKPYEALQPLGGGAARVSFSGPFQGREVVWEATLFTLSEHYRSLSTPTRSQTVRQFIQVGSAAEGRGEVTVGLNVPAIDEPTVLKTMLMLRQWRRLGPGRHEYGPGYPVNDGPQDARP